MTKNPVPIPKSAQAERARLRAAVLELGAFLGWQPHEVISFSEALTGRSWPHCGRADLEIVLEEYQTLIQVIEAKVARSRGAERHATRGLDKARTRTRLAAARDGGSHAERA